MTREIAEHLRYFADMGVDGVSKDVKWRQRPAAVNPPEGGHHQTINPPEGGHYQTDVAPGFSRGITLSA